MKRRFFISDTHFGDKGPLNRIDYNGKPQRDFASVDDMDEHMIERWNSVIRDGDTVYHLGDVAMPRRSIACVSRLRGRKILVKGNHDIFRLKDYTPYFSDIRAYVVRDNILFSHMPVHPREIYRFGHNVHGHVHNNTVNDSSYLNVCVEAIDYTPIELDEVIVRLAHDQGSI